MRKLLVGFAVVWTLWAFAAEMVESWRSPSPARALAARPNRWTLRTAQVRQLEEFLAEVDRRLPPGRRIAVAAPSLPGPQGFFVYLWHAYFLPHHDVVRADSPRRLRRAEYLLTYRSGAGQSGLPEALSHPPVLVFEHPVGHLYRLRQR